MDMIHGFGVEHLAVLLIFGTGLVAVLGWILLGALKILRGQPADRKNQWNGNETRIIQEIHHGLQRMEKRVETLETLMLDQATKEDETAKR